MNFYEKRIWFGWNTIFVRRVKNVQICCHFGPPFVPVFPRRCAAYDRSALWGNANFGSFTSDHQRVKISGWLIIIVISPIGIVASLVSMGINCLLPFLKGITKETFISAFKGKTAAVDASCWLHKGLTISVQRTGRYERWVPTRKIRLNFWSSHFISQNLLISSPDFCFILPLLHSYVGICNGYLDLLLRHGVKPIVVFDGFPLPAKDDERAQRKR